jgi:hypothetical protein
LQTRPSIQYVLTLWAAGFHLHRGDKNQAVKMLHIAMFPATASAEGRQFNGAPSSDLDRAVARALGAGTDEYHAERLAQDFPLTEDDVQAIAAQLNAPEPLAHDWSSASAPSGSWGGATSPTPQTSGQRFRLLFRNLLSVTHSS